MSEPVEKKGDLSRFKRGIVVGVRWAVLCTSETAGITEIGPKKGENIQLVFWEKICCRCQRSHDNGHTVLGRQQSHK